MSQADFRKLVRSLLRNMRNGMVVAENGFLLLVGTFIGSASALVAVAPRYLTGALRLPFGSLLATLGVVFLVGILSSIAAVLGTLRVPLLPVLKEGR